MKKILVILLIVALLLVGYMYCTKDTNPTVDKVTNWASEFIPEQIAKMYTIKGYDIVNNDDNTVDIILHCERNEEVDE